MIVINRRTLNWIGLMLLGIVILTVPVQTTVVPEWRLRVVTKDGRPCAGVTVSESWEDYTLELESGKGIEDKKTDQDGYVTFPQRVVRATLFTRSLRTIASYLTFPVHGSLGKKA